MNVAPPPGNQKQIKRRRYGACGFLTIARNNCFFFVVVGDNPLFDVGTRCQLSLKPRPTLSSQQELGRGPVIKQGS